ncbi:fructosamine kinase family protein [Andreprevotia chitinilytica]|uniref:fructosamine kinase family protein n=1 Tax=Andreprevotia chitinilytica TaxID=396808 RepID=UPI0005516C1F|nr:fructosamine kinase family protein [Andreprevotia chitinilytica]
MIHSPPTRWQTVADALSRQLGVTVTVHDAMPVSGGDINVAYRLHTSVGRFFIKLNRTDRLDMFAAEARGLAALAAVIRVPKPITYGVDDDHAWLLLEWLDLDGRADEAQLGEQLAAVHRLTAKQFGWPEDNTIGSTPQANGWLDDWITFWRERRLQPQVELAARNGFRFDEATKLIDALPLFFAGYTPQPSLLHGDLWGGNAAGLADGTPVLFDPACYYGDRETDLAMTELFGGFGPRFQAAYRAAWPLDGGYALRRDLYNLYHVLNHVNLFGGGYASQAERMVGRLLAAVRA